MQLSSDLKCLKRKKMFCVSNHKCERDIKIKQKINSLKSRYQPPLPFLLQMCFFTKKEKLSL